jgi:hypothetical protein
LTLPPLDPAFRWSAEAWGHALRCRPLESAAQHLFTTRQLPLRAAPALAWSQAAASLGARPEQVKTVKQVHGSSIRVLHDEAAKTQDLLWDYGNSGELWRPVLEDPPDADAIVSNRAGLVLAVQVADCVPILLADRNGGAAGAVHAGWRGTKKAIVLNVVDAMFHEFGTDPADLIVAIGPSIGACCYEVGEEVFEAFRGSRALDRQFAEWFSRTDTGSLRLDLWTATRDQLRHAGVPGEQIHAAHLCTQTHSDIFESFRAAGAGAGRMAALIRVQS